MHHGHRDAGGPGPGREALGFGRTEHGGDLRRNERSQQTGHPRRDHRPACAVADLGISLTEQPQRETARTLMAMMLLENRSSTGLCRIGSGPG